MRKVIQIVDQYFDQSNQPYSILTALCNDGTMWAARVCEEGQSEWQEIAGVPEAEPAGFEAVLDEFEKAKDTLEGTKSLGFTGHRLKQLIGSKVTTSEGRIELIGFKYIEANCWNMIFFDKGVAFTRVMSDYTVEQILKDNPVTR